ncbi:hypothetical protein EJB05_26979, partial [Eragrostis curvula]
DGSAIRNFKVQQKVGKSLPRTHSRNESPRPSNNPTASRSRAPVRLSHLVILLASPPPPLPIPSTPSVPSHGPDLQAIVVIAAEGTVVKW